MSVVALQQVTLLMVELTVLVSIGCHCSYIFIVYKKVKKLMRKKPSKQF